MIIQHLVLRAWGDFSATIMKTGKPRYEHLQYIAGYLACFDISEEPELLQVSGIISCFLGQWKKAEDCYRALTKTNSGDYYTQVLSALIAFNSWEKQYASRIEQGDTKQDRGSREAFEKCLEAVETLHTLVDSGLVSNAADLNIPVFLFTSLGNIILETAERDIRISEILLNVKWKGSEDPKQLIDLYLLNLMITGFKECVSELRDLL